MRLLFLVLVWSWSATATAELYRWVDPETGSVKFSSYPPPWFGDPLLEGRAPKVEHIPPRGPGGSAQPEAPANVGAASQDLATMLEPLEAKRKALMAVFSSLPKTEDFSRAGEGLRQQVDAYEAVRAEMDRLDPKGAARRNAAARPVLERIVEGLRAQFGGGPPVPGR